MKYPFFALLSFALLTVTFTFAQDTPATVVDVVTNDGDLSTLATALEAAGLVETLQDAGPFTVLAPTDEAFAALPAGELDRLLTNPDELRQILSYHVAEERLDSEAISEFADDSSSAQALVTLAGSTLSFTTRENADEPVYVNNEATLTETDLPASNGVVHLIDAVLLPAQEGATGSAGTGGNTTGGSPSGQ